MANLFLQALKFIGISGIGWLLDFGTYTALGLFSKNLFLNNTISSWIGVTFTFVFSTKSVFKHKSAIPLKVKYLFYILYQAVLIFFISKLVNIVDEQILQMADIALIKNMSFVVAKIIVTPITMILNFFVMKGMVEKL